MAVQGVLADVIMAFQDHGLYPPDPERVAILGEQGKEMEAKWEQNSQYFIFFITFMAVITIGSKFLPKTKPQKEIIGKRAAKEAQLKEAKKKKLGAEGAGGANGVDGGSEGKKGDGPAGEEIKERGVSITPYIIIIGILLHLNLDRIFFMLGFSEAGAVRRIYTCAIDQPLWSQTEYFFPRKSLPELQVSFDEHGLKDFESDTELQELQVPEDMVGGNLQVFKGDRGDPAHDPSVLASPDLVLEAEENTAVQMRGDVYMQMEPYRSRAAGHLRVVMLEQYLLPPDLLKHNVKHFLVHQQTVAEEDEARQRAQEGKKGAAETDKVLDKVLVKETVEKKPVKSDR